MILPYSNLQISHWNPGATMPLIMPILVICNTSDEDLHHNIRINSRRPGDWLAQSDAHGGVAVLCGSGPSLTNDLHEIERRQADGGTVFAMNGAARFLKDNGILADYQLIIDPRPVTADLVGPAKRHMFASQVHPDCFERAPGAAVWHLQIEGIDDLLPEYDRPFALLGGAASVGNTGAVLAYVMGYRELHLYGYDSSHTDGKSHAFHQKINDGEPCASVNFNRKDYRTSLTMKLQAEKFQETGRALENAGCNISVHGTGLLPDMWNTPQEDLSEREKYQRMWTIPGYRKFAPGEDCAAEFLEIVKPVGRIIDFGCGTGRGGLAISTAGHDVILTDFTSNCRDDRAMALPFFEMDLTEPFFLSAPYGYCTDVMEHIQPEKVETVIRNIMTAARTVFFQISTVQDKFGAVINQVLHLTVQPHGWWCATFRALGFEITHEKDMGIASQFVVTRKEAPTQ